MYSRQLVDEQGGATNPVLESEEFEEPPHAAVQRLVVNEKQSLLVNIRQLWDSIRLTVIILGTALTILAAARNSITWHLQLVWGASGDYWAHCWQRIYDWFEGNHFTIGVWGTLSVTFAVFWCCNLLFIILDTTGMPKFLLKYKIQEDKNVPVDRSKLFRAVVTVLFNQAITWPMIYAWYHVMKYRGSEFVAGALPTFHWVLFEIVVFTLVEELMFYYSHRLFHHPRLYKYVHKKHHEWTAPIGIVSIYAHPLEHLISNVLPPLTGPVLMGSHIASAWLWFSIALMSTTVSHCGYHMPFLPSPEAHDFHHLKFNNNFGVLGVLDRLHGTDAMFRATKQYQRHFLSLSIVPVTEQIPADHKKGCINAKSE